ncbi:RNA polymerase sigma factor [Spirosoma jeollabukense]
MITRTLPVYATDHDFYDALKRRDESAYQLFYADVFPKFQYWILRNNGTDMDAEDAFQKGLMNFLLNLESGKYEFQESTRVTTVAFEYCKKVWFTELGSARLKYRGVMPDHIDTADTRDVIKDLERKDTINSVQLALRQLKEDCRKLLEWFYVDDVSLREIADRLGMKEESIKSKRYQCAEKLKGFLPANR